LVQTIRDNPIPAAMAAVGIGWLMTHRSSGSDGSRWSSQDPWRGRSAWADGGSHAGGPADRYGRTQDGPGATQGLTDTLQDRAGDVGDALGTVPGRLGDTAEGAMGSFQRLLDDSPLAVGAAAIAAGAAIGMALPASRFEQETLGSGTQRLIGSAERTVTDTLQQARQEASSTPSV